MEDASFLTEDEIKIVCPNSKELQVFKFSHIAEGDFRIYVCDCCGHHRIFPSYLPDARYENEGKNLIETTNRYAMGDFE